MLKICVLILQISVVTGWSICFISILLVIFIPHDLYKLPENLFLTSLYHTTYRTIWTLCISWIVFACQFGYGGPINSFLSFSIWRPFVRLAFCFYLLHMQIQTIDIGFYRTPGYFTDMQIVSGKHSFKIRNEVNFILYRRIDFGVILD